MIMDSRKIKKTKRRVLPRKLREAVKERDGGLCRIKFDKGCLIRGNEIDHIIPFAVCEKLGYSENFRDSLENLQFCCSYCNRKKGIKRFR